MLKIEQAFGVLRPVHRHFTGRKAAVSSLYSFREKLKILYSAIAHPPTTFDYTLCVE